ncbi:uncharacterized protein HKW66_Vig0084690 [Vigna angularis]|uniref:Uncharacterized protein n=1 Tax=Phaseolus angularis TaxID=3914 RepID=A0A8T0KIU6_PHAAN|nr:uncharacterized protein HKW66_Vig0084690 [Vigna angularis]
MAMTKLLCVLLLALLAISMITTQVMAKDAAYHLDRNALLNAQEDVARHSTTSHACSSVKSAAKLAYVFPLATMGTSLCAPATTTGRPSVEDPNALEVTQA